MRRFLLTVLGMVYLVASAAGQASAPVPDQTELIKSLLERIDKLENRVDELESKQACSYGGCQQTSVMIASIVAPPLVTAREAPGAASHSTASDPKPRSGNACPGAVNFSILADPRIWGRRFFGDQSTGH